eukprot:scaffold88094_cov21-Tisochrysis_lutea.AAC.1
MVDALVPAHNGAQSRPKKPWQFRGKDDNGGITGCTTCACNMFEAGAPKVCHEESVLQGASSTFSGVLLLGAV